jgi:hypothetical protein
MFYAKLTLLINLDNGNLLGLCDVAQIDSKPSKCQDLRIAPRLARFIYMRPQKAAEM